MLSILMAVFLPLVQSQRQEYVISPMFPEAVRIVREDRGVWIDRYEPTDYVAVWAMDERAAENIDLLEPHMGFARPEWALRPGPNMVLDALRYEASWWPKGLPLPPLKKEDYIDQKGRTQGTGGARRHHAWRPFARVLRQSDRLGIMREMQGTIEWNMFQLWRPYCHSWPPVDWPTGRLATGPDGKGRTMDDAQHMCSVPQFVAASLGYPIGLFNLANQCQLYAYDTAFGQGTAGREVCWRLDLWTKAAMLGIGEDQKYADAFLGGRSAKEWLVWTIERTIEFADRMPYNGTYRNYKIPRLPEWPMVITVQPEHFGPGSVTLVQPSNIGEYPWQEGMMLTKIRYACDYLGDTRETRLLRGWAEQHAYRLWLRSKQYISGCTSFYEWRSFDDAFKIVEQLRIAQDTEDWKIISLPNGSWTVQRPGHQLWEKENSIQAMVGVACWLDSAMFSAEDRSKISKDFKRLVEERWATSNNNADLIAPGVAALQRFGAW